MVGAAEEAKLNRLEIQVDNGGGGAWEYLCLVRKLKVRRSDKVLKHGLTILNNPKARSKLGAEGQIHSSSLSRFVVLYLVILWRTRISALWEIENSVHTSCYYVIIIEYIDSVWVSNLELWILLIELGNGMQPVAVTKTPFVQFSRVNKQLSFISL